MSSNQRQKSDLPGCNVWFPLEYFLCLVIILAAHQHADSCCLWWQVTLLANCSAISHMSTFLVNIIQSHWFSKISQKNLLGLIISANLFHWSIPSVLLQKSASGVEFSSDCFTSEGRAKNLLSCLFFLWYYHLWQQPEVVLDYSLCESVHGNGSFI